MKNSFATYYPTYYPNTNGAKTIATERESDARGKVRRDGRSGGGMEGIGTERIHSWCIAWRSLMGCNSLTLRCDDPSHPISCNPSLLSVSSTVAASAMKGNADLVIDGTRSARLVPYRREHVPLYHGWMEREDLREATASEQLTLEVRSGAPCQGGWRCLFWANSLCWSLKN